MAELSGKKGQFVFLAITRNVTTAAPASSPSVGGASSDEMARMRAELEALKAQVGKPVEPPKPIEEASLPTYSLVKAEAGGEIVGKDGVPMMLVPEGEFLYGDNNERLSLPTFSMDKYEVSIKLYAAFLQATGRSEPKGWSRQVALVGGGGRPVVNVSWQDVHTYCRHYGKRLPTE